MSNTSARTYGLKAAATKIGVSPITLKRWLLAEKVGEVARNRNGWRIFTEQDISRIRIYADTTTPPRKS
ncbi:MAG: MerR family transcriptional regulator [Acidobacteria bacterium]|nr:MerR family transcriptional regulator [Acidobacteriota bacterium]